MRYKGYIIKTLQQVTSIWLTTERKSNNKSIPIKIDNYLLDLYSLKTYKTLYVDSKDKVNEDIRNISRELDSTVVRSVKAHLIMSLVSSAIRKEVKKIYT